MSLPGGISAVTKNAHCLGANLLPMQCACFQALEITQTDPPENVIACWKTSAQLTLRIAILRLNGKMEGRPQSSMQTQGRHAKGSALVARRPTNQSARDKNRFFIPVSCGRRECRRRR